MTCSIWALSSVSDQQHIFWYEVTNAQRGIWVSNYWSRGCIDKNFSDVNQQVVGHQSCYLLMGFNSGFRKEKETIPFQCCFKSTIWKARFYSSQFSFSQNVEEKCQPLLLLPPATVQMFGKCKNREMKQKENPQK